MVAREEDLNLFRLGAGVRVSPSPEGDLSDPGREGPGAGCPGGPRRGSRPRVRAAAPRKEPRTPQHAVPAAAAADPEVRAPPPRSPPSPCAARPGAGGRARIGAPPSLFRSAGPAPPPASRPAAALPVPPQRDAGSGPGRGPRAEAWRAWLGTRQAAVQGPGPRPRARPSRRPGAGRLGGRAGGGGRRRAGGAREARSLAARGRAAEGARGAPRPPKEESGSHLQPRTRGKAAAAGGAPAPARLPPGSPCLPRCALLLAAAAAAEEEPGARVDPVPHDAPKPPGYTRFVCVSDTHSRTDPIQMPYGDVLIHAGDFTELGLPSEVKKFNEWLGSLPYEYKIVIAGNHELTFDQEFMADLIKQDFYYFPSVSKLKPENYENVQSLLTNCIYLQDSEVTVRGFRIYGSPWQPWFYGWGFNLPRGQALLEKWNLIPEGVDILITHGPPLGFLDWVPKKMQRVGCVELLNTVQRRVQPRLHVFGHIHEGYGVMADGTTTYVNASVCTVNYQPVNPPIVIDLPTPRNS
uniref:Metallophosphoesterase domain containing 1 n=2 Tax=Boreoeutheria TaxID=1437010 RepID=A0A5F8AJX5_MACMU